MIRSADLGCIMSDELIYVGTCPVCEGGLCRVRVCGVASNHLNGMVICDECEAIWPEPDLSQACNYLDAENPVSPITGDSVWDHANRWATLEDVALLGWYDRVIVEPTNSSSDSQGVEINNSESKPSPDSTYGLDDPKPGC